MRFKVGEIAIIAATVCRSAQHLVGTECTIVAANPSGVTPGFPEQYECACADGSHWFGFNHHLIKKPGSEYDGSRIVSWDDCPWQPEKVEVR